MLAKQNKYFETFIDYITKVFKPIPNKMGDAEIEYRLDVYIFLSKLISF